MDRRSDIRLGDQPGYFMSEEFWNDYWRNLAAGKFTSRAPKVPEKPNKISKSDSNG